MSAKLAAGDLVAPKDAPEIHGVLVGRETGKAAVQWLEGGEDLAYVEEDGLTLVEQRRWLVSFSHNDDGTGPREVGDPLDADALGATVLAMLVTAARADLAKRDHDGDCADIPVEVIA